MLQDIKLHQNVGWRNTAGPIGYILAEGEEDPLNPKLGPGWVGDSGMMAHTFSADIVPQRNMLDSECCNWTALVLLEINQQLATTTATSVAMPELVQLASFDRRPVLSWGQPRGSTMMRVTKTVVTGAVAWSCDLARTPSLAGQLAYFAMRVRLPIANADDGKPSAIVVALWIDPGTGVWQRSCGGTGVHDIEDKKTTARDAAAPHHTAGCLRGTPSSVNPGAWNGDGNLDGWSTWSTISFTTTLARKGIARFAVHVEGAPLAGVEQQEETSQLLLMAGQEAHGTAKGAAVVVAPVGAAWTTLGGPH